MKSAGKARSNGLYRHIRTSKEIIRNLLNDYYKNPIKKFPLHRFRAMHIPVLHHQHRIHLFAAERCHYQASVDTSAAATADSWSDYEVEKA